MSLRRIKFRGYSGFRIIGNVDVFHDDLIGLVAPFLETRHFHRAFMTTFLVESEGRFGSVMNYDGTAMTAGACQNILVYPRELAHEDDIAEDDQGSLGKLVSRIELIPDVDGVHGLWDMFEEEGWYLASGGKLRWLEDGDYRDLRRSFKYKAGDIVHGRILRDKIMGGKHGQVASGGSKRECAEEWLHMFHSMFSDEKTFHTQVEFEMEHILKTSARINLRTTAGVTSIQNAIYGDTHVSRIEPEKLGLELDLALCFFWSNLVNAPGKARRVLERTAREFKRPDEFATELVLGLGNTDFARWDDDLKHGRYQRTRRCMIKLGLWPDSFFKDDGIMPKNLPG